MQELRDRIQNGKKLAIALNSLFHSGFCILSHVSQRLRITFFFMTLSNKVALVTGGAKRVGKAIVRTLAARGCQLIVHYHSSKSDAEETVQELLAAGHAAIALQADITQEADVDRIIESACQYFGR